MTSYVHPAFKWVLQCGEELWHQADLGLNLKSTTYKLCIAKEKLYLFPTHKMEIIVQHIVQGYSDEIKSNKVICIKHLAWCLGHTKGSV